VLLSALAARVNPLAPELVRTAFVPGFVTWIILDSLGSILSGNVSIAVFNMAVLAIRAGPMWRPEMSPEQRCRLPYPLPASSIVGQLSENPGRSAIPVER
jgi:hypothetical protein